MNAERTCEWNTPAICGKPARFHLSLEETAFLLVISPAFPVWLCAEHYDLCVDGESILEKRAGLC